MFRDFGVKAFSTNLIPASTAAFISASKATLFPTSKAEDAICLGALLVKSFVKKLAMLSNIPAPPYAYFLLNPRFFSDNHFL